MGLNEFFVSVANWFARYWPDISGFFNSVFFTSIAGSLTGAFAGAYGAQRIAERAKVREQLLMEIRHSNAASMVAFGICNSLLSVKKQYVRELKDNFDNQRTALLEFLDKRRAGQISKDEVFDFRADLPALLLPPLPVDVLRVQIFEKLSIGGRALALTVTLGQTLHDLNTSLERRNAIIAAFQEGSKRMTPATYFGLREGDRVDADYASTIEAIYTRVDDGIFFSSLLCEDVRAHCMGAVERYKKQFGKRGAPNANEPDFSKAVQAGLMPNVKNYSDWLTMFRKREPGGKATASLTGTSL